MVLAFLSEGNPFILSDVTLILEKQGLDVDSAVDCIMVGAYFDEAAFANCGLSHNTRNNIRAILAEGFTPASQSKMIWLGIMPLLFKFGMSASHLQMEENEHLDCRQLSRALKPNMDVLCRITRASGLKEEFVAKCGIQAASELEAYQKAVLDL